VATGSRTKSRTSKAEQAQATRDKIVGAATDLFLRDGFLSTTMAMIAQGAGVAVQTLYLSFGSKTAILQAAFDQALRGHPDEADLLEQDWFNKVLADPDGVAALRLFCTSSAEVVGRAAPLFKVMRAASADPEVGEMLAHNLKLRHDGFRMVTEAITSRPGLRDDLSVDDAHGILFALVSEDTYLLLVTEHGWTPQHWTSWVTESCTAQFFS
jgi:AcrR family transcriptional regulator